MTMARQRTGTLQLYKGGFRARVTATVNGKATRLWFDLGTSDRLMAKRKLARLVQDLDAGTYSVEEAARKADGIMSVSEFATMHFERRESRGVVMVVDERMYFRRHVEPHIGSMTLVDVRPVHVREVLDRAIVAGLMRESVTKVRGLMNRIFKEAWQKELIDQNPVEKVEVPEMREVRKQRVILTDEEFAAFISHPTVDVELKMMCLVARVLGGMRQSDLIRWDWTMIDRVHFESAFIPRSKTGTPDALEVPEVIRPFLRKRWEEHGQPESGAVFPCERGERVGDFKSQRGNSYADRLRRNLIKSGIFRMPPIQVPKTSSGTRTDLGRRAEGTKLSPNPHDPLYFETATTLPVDFHSFRRAFNTALAEAGVNVQQAMRLAGHTNPKTHMRYVMSTAAMKRLPERTYSVIQSSLERTIEEREKSTPVQVPEFPEVLARPTGLEPVTRGLEGRGFPQDFGFCSTKTESQDGISSGNDPTGNQTLVGHLSHSSDGSERLRATLSALYHQAANLANTGDVTGLRELHKHITTLLQEWITHEHR